MANRINLHELEPNAYKAMYALEDYLRNSSLSTLEIELIKIRASQINGCAHCLNMHTEDAIKLGEDPRRIFLMSVWRETDVFSEKEQVLLAVTEEVTLIHEKGLTDETYNWAVKVLDEHYLGQVIMAVTVINAWNRMAISTGLRAS